MASFTEEATLKLNDQASAKIRKINAELSKLAQTAGRLKNIQIGINISGSGVNKLRQLQQQMAAMHGMAVRPMNVRLNVNASGIQQAQQHLARLQAQARRGVNINVTQTGGGGGGAGGPGGAGPGGTGGRRGGIGRFAGRVGYGVGRIGQGAASTILGPGLAGTAFAAGAAVGRSVIEGTKRVTTGDAMLQMLQLDRVFGKLYDARKVEFDVLHAARISQQEAEKSVVAGKPMGAFWGLADRKKIMAEIIADTGIPSKLRAGGRADLRGIIGVLPHLESLEEAIVTLGHTAEDAREQTLLYYKGLSQGKKLTDQAGQFDPRAAEEWFGFLRQMMPTIGREFTGGFFRNIMKYLAGSKSSIDKGSLAMVLMLGEEQGTRAAVAYDTLRNQMMGVTQNVTALRALEKLGMLKTRMEGRRLVAIPETVREFGLLQRDLPEWIEQVLKPELRARVRPKAEKEADERIKAGVLRPEDREEFLRTYLPLEDVQKFVNLFNMSKAGREELTSLIERNEELIRQRREAFARSGSVEDFRATQQDSIVRAGAALSNQFQSMAGGLVQKMAPILLPEMAKANRVFSGISRRFEKDQKPLTSGEYVSLADTLFPALMAGAATMMLDPKTAPMGGAALTLLAAGKLLLEAARSFPWMKGAIPLPQLPIDEAPTPHAAEVRKAETDLEVANLLVSAAEQRRKQLLPPGRKATAGEKRAWSRLSPQEKADMAKRLADADAEINKLKTQRDAHAATLKQLREAEQQAAQENVANDQKDYDIKFKEHQRAITAAKKEAELDTERRRQAAWRASGKKGKAPKAWMPKDFKPTEPKYPTPPEPPKPVEVSVPEPLKVDPQPTKPPDYDPEESFRAGRVQRGPDLPPPPYPHGVRPPPGDLRDWINRGTIILQPNSVIIQPPAGQPAIEPPPAAPPVVEPPPVAPPDPLPLPPLPPPVDSDEAPRKMGDAIKDGGDKAATAIGGSGTTLGNNASSAFNAAGLGTTLGRNARAQLEGVTINVNANVEQTPRVANRGPQNVVT